MMDNSHAAHDTSHIRCQTSVLEGKMKAGREGIERWQSKILQATK
jgi:hypothetical protein